MFVDETWAKTNMTRTYGRSPRGQRLVDRVPYGRWETTTFLGAMRSTGFVAPLCVEGAINGALFQAWVEQHLVKVLRPGDTVVMDNLSSHKGSGVAAAIEAVDAGVRYPPPYSPDLNPIELAFSKFTKTTPRWRSADQADSYAKHLIESFRDRGRLRWGSFHPATIATGQYDINNAEPLPRRQFGNLYM